MIRHSEASPPRPGFTLTEVLMAMFVMALGMISLLALFPAAFIQARWALDNEQVARAAANGQSITEIPHVAVESPFPTTGIQLVGATAANVRNDDIYRPEWGNNSMAWKNVLPALLPPRLNRGEFLWNPLVNVLTLKPEGWTFNPNINAPKPQDINSPLTLPSPLPNAKVVTPPVFVDAFIAQNPVFNGFLPFHVGVNAKDDATGLRVPFAFNQVPIVAANSNPALRPTWSVGIPRFSLSQYTRNSAVIPGASAASTYLRMVNENGMSDEIDFAPTGQPNLNTSGTFASQSRFSWGYMCQWYDYSTPEICDVACVVFNARPTNGGMATFPPGEETYKSKPQVALGAGIEAAGPNTNCGRVFIKGLTQAAIKLDSLEPSKIKAGDWILDSTMILPEYNSAAATTYPNASPKMVAPFLDQYDPRAVYVFTPAVGVNVPLRPGLVGGHFYKVLDISPVLVTAGEPYQTITLDRPAKSDGFCATHLAGVADVITKSAGRMPQR